MEIVLDENRSVIGIPFVGGIDFKLNSHGVITQIALTYEAINALKTLEILLNPENTVST